MKTALRNAIDHAFLQADQALAAGDPQRAWPWLERAHILSQPSFIDHSLSHVWLFAWAWRQRDFREMAAQLLRLPGSLGSLAGVYPLGNPGTRRVGPLVPQPVPEDLRAFLARG